MATTPRLVPFRADHLRLFVNRDNGQNHLLDKANNPAFTAILNHKIYGCAGIILNWPGFATAWTLFTKELIDEYPIWTTKTVRAVLKDWIRMYKLQRIELTALAEHKNYGRWAEALGFEAEHGYARKYTPDHKDVIRYELIP